MKKPFKIALSLLGILAVVVIVALVTVANIDPNNHKDWIVAQVRDSSGQTLRLDGDIQWSLYPWLGVTVDNVSLENPPGFAATPLLTIEHAAIRARLLPLLRRNVEIDTVTLRGVNAHLVTNADGRSNWTGLTEASETAEPAPAPSGGMPFNDLRLGGVSIEDVNLLYEDLGSGNRVTLSDFRFATDALVYGEPIAVDLGFTVAATAPALDADISLRGVVNYDLDNGRYGIEPLQLIGEVRGANVPDGRASITLDTALQFDLDNDSLRIEPISLQAPATRLEASLTGTGLQGRSPRLETRIDLAGGDLALLFRMAGIEPLATQLQELGDRRFTLQSELVMQPARGGVDVAELQLALLGATVNGNLQMENLNGDAPLLRGELVAAGPNLPSVLEVIGQVSGGSDSKLAVGGRLMQGIDDKAFSIDAQFDADLGRGSAEISRLDMDLLGATVQGSFTAGALDSERPNVRGRLQANGADLPQLMQIGGWFHDGDQSPVFIYGGQFGVLQDKSFTVDTEFAADLRSGAIDVPTIQARALGLQLDGHFEAANINNGNGNVSGALALSGNNLGNLLSALDQAELAEVARSLDLNLEFGGTSNNLAVNPARLELVLAGNRIPNSPVTVALNAASRINVERETLQLEQFTLAGLGLDSRGSVNASKIFSAPELSGNIELASFNLRRLLQQLNQPVPDTADDSVLQAVALKTGFSASATGLSLSDLELQLDETQISGNLSLNAAQQSGAAGESRVDIRVGTIDLDRYLAEPEAVDSPVRDDSTMPIPVDTIRGLNVRGTLAIDQLQVAGMSLAEVSASFDARDGRVSLAPLGSKLYQGTFNGSMALDASGDLPAATVNVTLQQVAMEALMMDMMDASYVTGRGSLQLDLRSSGHNTLALRQGLNGSGRINLEDGVLRGVDVAGVLTQLETMIRSRRAGELTRGQQTPFESFSATLAFDNGVVNSNDLLIKSPGFQVNGRGTLLNLHDDSIAYNLVTAVDAATATRDDQQYDIGGYSVPIACSGTLAAPRCLPDSREILANLVRNELRDRVSDLLQEAIGNDEPDNPDANDAANADNQDATPPNPADLLINRALQRIRNN